MAVTLVAIQGPLVGQRFPISDQPLTLGRDSENAVVLTSPFASRFHAEVRPEGGGYVLHDLGSRNGTRVNSTRVTARQLHPGEQILIGREAFRFESDDLL